MNSKKGQTISSSFFKSFFSEFQKNKPKDLLHFASHSHHAWPDASLKGQLAYWQDSISLLDHKWGKMFSEVVPSAKEKIREILNLSNKDLIVFGGNTFELAVKLLSTFDYNKQLKILTTDSEYHSFNRYSRRLEEEDAAIVDRLALDPLDTFEERFLFKAKEGETKTGTGYDLVFFSHVFFSSGVKIDNIVSFVNKLDQVLNKETYVIVDGYHSFCCFQFDFSPIEQRAFYLGGGYKYAMAGEGCGFMVCPPSYGMKPRITGWLADYEALEKGITKVNYSTNADRFKGATADLTPIYRFDYIWEEFKRNNITVDIMHRYIKSLQCYFLKKLNNGYLNESSLIAPVDKVGNYLVFKVKDAKKFTEELNERKVMVDYRGNNLRIGFAIYHDEEDVDELILRINDIKHD